MTAQKSSPAFSCTWTENGTPCDQREHLTMDMTFRLPMVLADANSFTMAAMRAMEDPAVRVVVSATGGTVVFQAHGPRRERLRMNTRETGC